MNTLELRTRLDEATRTKDNRLLQPGLVAAIPGCTARVVAADDPRRPANVTYNCVAYALELVDSEDYHILTRQFHGLGADAKFILNLIQRLLLREIQQSLAVTGDIVIYFLNAEPQHAGKLSGTRVISKWGDGLLWDHAVLEVPVIYGDKVGFYQCLPRAAAELALVEYVATTLRIEPHRIHTLLQQRRSPPTVIAHAGA